jgi:hypothetical protein
MNTASQPVRTLLARTASRSLRLTLFLTTALPIRLLTTNPNLLWCKPLERKRMTRRRFAVLLPC